MAAQPKVRIRTLRDRLSHLNHPQACKLLGPNAKKLLRCGAGLLQHVEMDRDIYLRGDLFRLTLPRAGHGGTPVRVTITLKSDHLRRLCCNCDCCDGVCEHVAAALSLILEEKFALGLSEIPKEGTPLELLSEEDLELRAVAERAQRAKQEQFRMVSQDSQVTLDRLRGDQPGVGQDVPRGAARSRAGRLVLFLSRFPREHVGNLQAHSLCAATRADAIFGAATCRKARRVGFAVHLKYGREIELRLLTPDDMAPAWKRRLHGLLDQPIDDVRSCFRRSSMLERPGQTVVDVSRRGGVDSAAIARPEHCGLVQEIRDNPAKHPLRTDCSRNRCCPISWTASPLPSEPAARSWPTTWAWARRSRASAWPNCWPARPEFARCWWSARPRSSRSGAARSSGSATATASWSWASRRERALQYDNDCFFTICNYEQVLRDLQAIERVNWDLIILDEGQRIKNWEAKTSARRSRRCGRGSPWCCPARRSRTGWTNSIPSCSSSTTAGSGPAFRFFHRHRVVDEKGKVLGYKNLDELRANLQPILLRRTRDIGDAAAAAERTTEIVRIPPTDEQLDVHAAHMRIVRHASPPRSSSPKWTCCGCRRRC